MPSTVALITARGGSKGLSRKNLRLLGGKPLIAYTIAAALECPLIDECYVSSEDKEIQAVSRALGAAIIERPAYLATDDASSQDVISHALETLNRRGFLPEFFVLLQPTSPLRTALHVREALEFLAARPDACSIVSVSDAEHHPFKSFKVVNGYLSPLFQAMWLSMPRQELPRVLRQNGAIYAMRTRTFVESRSFFAPPVLPYVMSAEESVDIDSPADLVVAEALLQQRKVDARSVVVR